LKDKQVKVYDVLPGSIAEEAGIVKGDCILAINGEKISDIFDYKFLTTVEDLVLEVQEQDGEILEVEIEKDEYEDLGIEFDDELLDEIKCCKNKCIFCFMDQLPKNMRNTLYLKDDDIRLSFLMGNYVTLTNINDEDINRVIRYRMSPINVSVHTTNPELRVKMLNNKYAGDILDKIKRITESGIQVNCQIVLCKDINDKKELDRTISDLAVFFPALSSISIVPVGITKYRDALQQLVPFNKETSRDVILQVSEWQEKLYKSYQSRIVYLADEFYVMADMAIPEYAHYEDFPQIENGVGLIAQFKYEFDEYIETAIKSLRSRTDTETPRVLSIATGVSPYKYIKGMAEKLESLFPKLKINVIEIKNNFFGENVTVTGLLTGRDIAEQLTGKSLGDRLLICRCMLKSGEELFLDDYTVKMLQDKLNIELTIVENSGKDFIDKILEH
jgi:putative radical SAM enzyme (TIGR03279 family)